MGLVLLTRTKRALAGWADTLTGRSENPPQQPWRPWGDPRTVVLTSSGMVFGNDGGWFQSNPNGGMGYEFQPLTENWEITFKRTMSSYATDGAFRIYLDKNWTAGGAASSTRYQTYLLLQRSTSEEEEEDGSTTTTVDYYLRLMLRDTSQWITFGSKTAVLTAAQWNNGFTLKTRVYRDRTVVVWLDGVRVLFNDITDTRYNFTGGQRSANFSQQYGPTNTISNFSTRDIDGLNDSWTSLFYDDFNRGNNTSVGNGWSMTGSEYGIWNQALSMNAPFLPPGDGFRSAWRGPSASRDQRVEVTFGGGTGDPNDLAAAFVVLRANSGFSSGLAFRIRKQNITLMKFSGAVNSSGSYTDIWSQPTPDILINGMKLAFNVVGDIAWVDRIDGGRNDCLLWCDGIDGQVGDLKYFGAIHQRFFGANAVPFNDYRILNAA